MKNNSRNNSIYKHHIKLNYFGKEPVRNIINKIPLVMFNEIRTLGQPKLNRHNNMLVWGDNLVALQYFCHDVAVNEKIKLIYIDPPFSTNQIYKKGNRRTATVSKGSGDTNAYNDLLIGSEYLEFLRKRLILLKKILAKDGSIYVHIDWKMGHYVKILLDEVFGQERFINDIARIKCSPKNFERRAFGNIKDMILFYSKSKNYIWNDSREILTDEDLKRLFPKIAKDGRFYTTTPLHAPGETKNGPTGQKWKGIMPPKGRHWRCSPEELNKLDAQGLIEWSSTGNPRRIIYADDILAKGKKRQDIWEFKDHPYPSYPTEKNLDLLKVIIETSSNPGDIILDCFAGSGTTLVAAELMNRNWIGIDDSKIAIETIQKRLISLKDCSLFKIYKLIENKK